MVPAWVADRVPGEWWEPVARGYTRAPKWRVRLRDGTRAFLKFAEDDDLAVRTIAAEIRVYEAVHGPFMPTLYDSHNADDRALLLLEDLAEADWPPPYPEDPSPLFKALDAAASIAPPPHLPKLNEPVETPWQRFARAPEPLLSLGVCSAAWLTNALPSLIEAEARVPPSGTHLVHYDVWAENLCFARRGAVLVDWAEARIGNPAIDIAFALLSLRVESVQPPPVEDEPALAAFVTGVVASEAASPVPSWAASGSTLRQDQLADLRVALPWVADQLGLSPP
jgi:Phosphotransferase enzyme family